MSPEHEAGAGPVGAGEVRPGLRLRFRRTVTEADLAAAVHLTGDQNGYHVDAAFARAAGFRTAITPGLLQASLVTKLGGDLNLLAREMRFRFHKPVYPGDTLEAEVEVVEAEPERRRIACEATVSNQHGEVVLTCRVEGHLPAPEWGTPVKPPPRFP